MAKKRQLADGMERLVPQTWVDASSGGGVELPSLFYHVLSCVREPGQTMTLDEARQAISVTHAHQFVRMRTLYPGGDGVEACVRAVLDQLTLRGFLAVQDGVWVQGPRFALGTRLPVVQNPDGSWIGITLPAQVSTDASFEEQLARHNQDMAWVSALAARLAPEGPGLWVVDPERGEDRRYLDQLKRSVEDYGVLEGFPILVDQHGRVLSGRHRMIVERELRDAGRWPLDGPWPCKRITVRDDLHALRIALAANKARPRTKGDYERFGERLDALTQDRIRQLIRLALWENYMRSDREIARLVGASHNTVHSARLELENDPDEKRRIEVYRGQPGRGHTEAQAQQNGQIDHFAADDGLPRAGTLKRKVYDFLCAQPATDEQMHAAVAPDLHLASVQKARVLLERASLVRNTGVPGRSQHGRKVPTYIAVPVTDRFLQPPTAAAPRARGASLETTGQDSLSATLAFEPQKDEPTQDPKSGQAVEAEHTAPSDAQPQNAAGMDEGLHVGYGGELRTEEPDGPEWWGALEDDRPDHVICGRGVMDGARTLSEAAECLERYAAYLRQKEREGWQLVQTVMDDSGPARRGG